MNYSSIDCSTPDCSAPRLRQVLMLGAIATVSTATVSTATVSTLLAAAPAAIAAPLTADWTYTLDSFNDGTEAQTIGDDSTFEIYALAYRQQGRILTFALNSNLAVNALYDQPNTALGGSINYGDLLLNFSGEAAFADAPTESLYGIRFDAANDTGLNTGLNTGLSLGLYGNVTAQSLSEVNDGYGSFAQYEQAVRLLGGEPSLGGLEPVPYFEPAAAPPTHIASGDYLGEVELLQAAELTELDFAGQGARGQHTFGFQVDAGLLPTEEFIAHLLTECANDAIAFTAELAKPVTSLPTPPEPTPQPVSDRSGLVLAMAAGLGWKLRRLVTQTQRPLTRYFQTRRSRQKRLR